MSDQPTEAELTAAAVVSSSPGAAGTMSQGDVNRLLMDPEELAEREENAEEISDAMRQAREIQASGINPTLMYSRINTAHDGGMGTLSRMNPITFADEVAGGLTPETMIDPRPEAEPPEPDKPANPDDEPTYGGLNDQSMSMTPEDKVYREDGGGSTEYALRELTKSPHTDASQVGALHQIDGDLNEDDTKTLTEDGITDEGGLDNPPDPEVVDPDAVTNPWGGTPAQDTTSPVANETTIHAAREGDAEPDDEAQAAADEQIERNLTEVGGSVSSETLSEGDGGGGQPADDPETVDVNIVNDDPIPVTETEEPADEPVDPSTKADEDLTDEDYSHVTVAQLKTRLDEAGRFVDYTSTTTKPELWTLVTGKTHEG